MLRMLMREDVAQKIGRLFRSGIVPTASQLVEMKEAFSKRKLAASTKPDAVAASANEPENYAVVGSVAEIKVCGVLAEEPDFWAWIMGIEQTAYADIRDALALAAANPSVSQVVLSVDSPGGYVDGLFETLAALEAFGKPINVIASQACSAAYALAAMAGPIQAVGPASSFGSVGVATTYHVDPNQVDVASTNAPNKRPDVTTEEGRAVVRAELDAFHDIFVDAIARGRTNATGKSYTSKMVNTDFGRGGEVLPEAAKAAGMIDKLAVKAKRGGVKASAEDDSEESKPAPEKVAVLPTETPALAAKDAAPNQSITPRAVGQAKKVVTMNASEILAQFPAAHAEILAVGVAGERKRACAHLKLAKATGASEVAFAAIASGASTMDEDVHADYMAAAIGKRETSARQEDSDKAGVILSGVAPVAEGGKDLGDEVADRIEAMFGKKKA